MRSSSSVGISNPLRSPDDARSLHGAPSSPLSSPSHRRAIPCSPEHHVPLPPLHRAASSAVAVPTTTSMVIPSSLRPASSSGRGKGRSGAHARRQVRSNVVQSDAAHRTTHPSSSQYNSVMAPGSVSLSSVRAAAPLPKTAADVNASSHKQQQQHQHLKGSGIAAVAAPSPVLLRHTFDGTTRVLYANGHVDTFTTGAEHADGRSANAAAALSLPSLNPSVLSSEPQKTQPSCTSSSLIGASPSSASSPTSTRDGRAAHSTRAATANPSLPTIARGHKSAAAATSAQIVLSSFEAVAGSYQHQPQPLPEPAPHQKASEARPPQDLHSHQKTRRASLPHREDTRVFGTAASSFNVDGRAATPTPPSTKLATTATGRTSPSASARHAPADTANGDVSYQRSVRVASLDATHSASHEATSNVTNPRERGDGGFFLTSVPAEVLPLPLEDTATFAPDDGSAGAAPSSPHVALRLRALQHDLRAELAEDQRARTAFFANRFERGVHDSPSIFSLAFPFRPLREVYAEAGQEGGVPDIFLPAMQVTTPTGWTLPELLQQRLLPREQPALQHRFHELLALRGVVDAPDTMTCRFGVAFTWFVLLRCRKAHSEQALVDGHRRLAKAFADVFPLANRDTVPLLDVLGQLLVEMFTCLRYEDERARQRERSEEVGGQQRRQSSVPPSPVSTVPSRARRNLKSGGGTAAQDAAANTQRDGPHYADLSDILAYTNYFPLLTGEWAYLLRHAHTAVVATASSTVSITHLQQLQQQQSTTLDLSNQEQTRRMSILPSSKSLQALCTVYQELWLLHGKYVEACLYEEELYKQLAVLFRNLCVHVAHATAGPSAADVAAGASSSPLATASARSGKGKARRASCDDREKAVVATAAEEAVTPATQLSSRISVNPAPPTSFGSLVTSSSSAAKDAILDGLLIAIAHATYFTCVFGFPNDVYAGVFDEEFRTDIVQWLSYCCHGVVTTHVQTKHWPVPVQADYDAAQARRSEAEKLELAALGLQRQHAARERDASLNATATSSGNWTDAEVGNAAATEQQKPSASANAVTMSTTMNTSLQHHQQHHGSSSSARDVVREEPLDMENIVANAEFRLAHQFDRYSRAAVQHVSELERRMARLQRRHRLVGSRHGHGGHGNNGGGGGGLRRLQSMSQLSRAASFALATRANPSGTFNDDDDDALGASVRSLTSPMSRATSFRRGVTPGTPATKTTFAPRTETRVAGSSKSYGKSGARGCAPSFPLLDASVASLPAVEVEEAAGTTHGKGSGAAATKLSKPSRESISDNNNSSNNVASRHGNRVGRKSMAVPQPTALVRGRRSVSPAQNAAAAASPRYVHAGGGAAGVTGSNNNNNNGSSQRGDVRDLYRTSAFVKNDKSLVSLAAELNHNATITNNNNNNAAAADAADKSRPETSNVEKMMEDRASSSDRSSSVGEDVESEGRHHSARLAQAASTSAASLLSSYPLCTCPLPITEYWLAMLLRVSSWWVPASSDPLRHVDFTLHVSPTSAALISGNADAEKRVAEDEDEPSLRLHAIAHEPWRGIYGRVIAVPPISGAAQRAARLIDTLAESLPYQQSLVYQELHTQQLRREQRRLNAAVGLAQGSTTEMSIQPPFWNAFDDAANVSAVQGNASATINVSMAAMASVSAPSAALSHLTASMSAGAAAAVVVAALTEANLGTATIPCVPPVSGGLESRIGATQSTAGQSVASYLRRRGIGETYQGCTSPFFQLYASTCLALALTSEEVVQLRDTLDTARDRRREEAMMGGSLRAESKSLAASTAAASATTMHQSTNTLHHRHHKSNSLVLSQSMRVPIQQRDVHGQQVLSSLLPLLPPATTETKLSMSMHVKDRAAAAAAAVATGDNGGQRPSLAARSVRRQPRGAPSSSTATFAITAIPREEARLRPRRMRPLQEEALRRRSQLLSDMDVIEKRDGVARQNYLVQQLRLANTMAQLKTDTMLRRYRTRGRLALERLEVDDADAVSVRDGGERGEE